MSNPPTNVLAAPSEPTCVSSSLFGVPGTEPSGDRRTRRRVLAVLVVLAGLAGALLLAASGGVEANSNSTVAGATLGDDGFVTVTADGDIVTNGAAPFAGGGPGGTVAAVASQRNGGGYWVVNTAGRVRAYGEAKSYGDASGLPLQRPIVGMASTESGNGYWLVASDGGVFAYGDAGFHGSAGAIPLNEPIVGMTATASSNGYWLVASDGGVFAYGDAVFHGSAGALPLVSDIVGIAMAPGGAGYWLAGADGGVFAYGDAPFLGSSAGDGDLVVDIDRTRRGYVLTAADGSTANFRAGGQVTRTPPTRSSGDTGGGNTSSGGSGGGSSSGGGGGTPAGVGSVGVTNAGALQRSGSVSVTRDGAVVENLDINGSITVRANNVTIRNVRVRGNSSHLIRNEGQNLVIEDTTLIGERPCSAGIGFSNFTARRVDISGCADGMKANGNVLVENSYIHDLRKWSGTHNDGIQSTGGSNIVIRNNVIEGANRSSVSAIKLTSENRHLSDVVVQGNRLSGGNYTLYLTNKPGQRAPTDVQIIDNVFVDGTAKWGWRLVDSSPSQTWRGNTSSGGNALG
ncbi:MAG: hypothetical protein AAFZ07_05755 [Actinomycetota bacterium]